MSAEQLQETVKEAVKEAIKESLGQFNIDREKHYQDHQFVSELREATEQVKWTLLKTLGKGIGVALLVLLAWGIIAWGRAQFK